MVDREAGEEMAGELCPGLAVQPGLVAIRETSCECRRERAGGESGREFGPARPPQSAVTTDMEINPGRMGMERRAEMPGPVAGLGGRTPADWRAGAGAGRRPRS